MYMKSELEVQRRSSRYFPEAAKKDTNYKRNSTEEDDGVTQG